MKRSIAVTYNNGKSVALTWDPGIVLCVPGFWDCSCDDDFIHPDSQARCPKCGDEEQERPNARLDEMVIALMRATFKSENYNGTLFPTFTAEQVELKDDLHD